MAMRIVIVSACLSLLTFFTSIALLIGLPTEDRRLYYFSAALFGFHAFSLALRALWAVTHRSSSLFLPGSPPDYTSMFSLNFAVTGCCLAIATASSRKLYHTTRKLAMHDPLTQLPNRRMFEDRLAQLGGPVSQAKVALIYLDLDNFKVINETFGHTGGDEVLRTVGKRMMCEFAEAGLPVRLGGDEFVVLLEGIECRNSVTRTMEKLIRILQAEMRVGEHSVFMEISGGMALFPADVSSLDELTGVADRHMFRAKRSNRQFASLSDPLPSPRFSPSPKSIA
jgi:diguanylate cyclase (GGDEF)-like protein